MKLKEAVKAMIDGHVVEESTFYLRKKDGKIQFTSKSNSLNAGWVDVDANALIWMAETEYEIYQPKSVIEQAIDAEFPSDGTVPNACFRASSRRIVNLTLNEAKKAVSNYGDCGYACVVREAHKRIDALKVKE